MNEAAKLLDAKSHTANSPTRRVIEEIDDLQAEQVRSAKEYPR